MATPSTGTQRTVIRAAVSVTRTASSASDRYSGAIARSSVEAGSMPPICLRNRSTSEATASVRASRQPAVRTVRVQRSRYHLRVV